MASSAAVIYPFVMHVVYVIVYFKIQISVGLYVKRVDLNVLNHVFLSWEVIRD